MELMERRGQIEQREKGWEWAQWRSDEGRFMLGVTAMEESPEWPESQGWLGLRDADFTGDGDPYCDAK